MKKLLLLLGVIFCVGNVVHAYDLGYQKLYCMKQPILLFFLLTVMTWCLGTQAWAQEATTDQIKLSDLTYDSELEFYYFDVSLEGSRIYSAYDMDIFLPIGIDTDKDYVMMIENGANGIYPYNKLTKKYYHSVSASMPSERQLRIACVSMSNDEFTANSGALFRVYVTIDGDALNKFSPKPIVKVSGIALVVKEGAKKYVPADFSCRPFTTGIPAARELLVNISSDNKVGSLILPFAAAVPSGMKAYQYSSVDESEEMLNLEEVDEFEARKPYIVYAENGYSGNISGTVDYEAEYPDEDVYTNGGLTGVLSRTVVNTGYIMQNKNDGNGPQFYSAEGQNFSLPAGRCYMTIPPSNVRVFGFNFGEEEGTTEIVEVELENEKVEKLKSDEEWYTLQGVKLDQEPTEKGVYLYGTKKVFIK